MTEALTDAQFNKDVEFVRTHSETVYEWALAIRRIKESGKWEEQAETWDEWCRENCGRSAPAIRQIIWKHNARQSQKVIDETTQEPPEPKRLQADRPNTPKTIPEPKVMPARVDHSGPEIEVRPPPPVVTVVKGRTVTERLEIIKAEAYRLTERKDLSTAALRIAANIFCEAELALKVEQAPLIGMSIPSKKKGTVEECVGYCQEQGLTKSDGVWFFDKNEGCGWKINGRPMLDWRAVVRQWKPQGFFPSQKQLVNGKVVAVATTEGERKFDRLTEQLMKKYSE